MAGYFTIELKGLRFFARHGLYAEEINVGNEFEVDVIVQSEVPEKKLIVIEETINYAEVYGIVVETFKERNELLENAAIQIADKLERRFPRIQKLSISIRKLSPPITGFIGSVGINYIRENKNAT